MAFFTKSIQKKSKKADGIRICIMRRIKPEFEFDMWIPRLSPSTELLKDYHHGKLSWKEFANLFTQQVLETEEIYLSVIINIAQKNPVTLLCWELTPKTCHRRLVAERIVQMDPALKIIYK